MAYEGMAYKDNVTGFSIARDLAGEAMNPINWYQYFPQNWSVRRGQVRIPFVTGKRLQGVANWMGKQPMISRYQAVDKALQSTRMGGIMTSKSVWFGLKNANEAGFVGIYAPQDPDLIKSTASSGLRRSTTRTTSGPIFTKGFGRSPTRIPKPTYTPFFDVRIPADDIPQGFVSRAFGKTKGFMTSKEKFRMTTGAIGTGIDKTAAAVNRVKWGALGKGLSRGLVRGGVALGKGWAILSVASFMWDAINYVAEPLGRAAFSAMDSAFRAYEAIPTPELGGQLSMAYLTQGAATERQRALQAISKAHINGRSALGMEAQYAHR